MIKRKFRREQTRAQSFVEQIVSQLATFIFAVMTAQLFIFDIFDVEVTLLQNISMMSYWMIQNIILRYFLRRFFERRVI